jgi:hypothetical protein
MGMIFTGIVAAVIIAIGAGYFLNSQSDDRPAWQVYSTSSVRVGDPGENLVGPGWTGEAELGAAEVETDTPAS